jgi:lipopolysaccharide export LptBFGC system permease protein LptF
MRLLDRYVVRTFFTVFFTSLVVFSVAITTLDFFGRLDSFMGATAVDGAGESVSRMALIGRFYLAFIPFVLKDTLSFVTVAAGMFTVSHMLRNNEVQPVLAAGVSARRLFLPVLICGFIVTLGQIAFQEMLVPALNREQVTVRQLLAGGKSTLMDDVPHLRDGKGTVTQATTFDFQAQVLGGVIIARAWEESGYERWFVDRLEADGDQWRAATEIQIQPAGVSAVGRTLPAGTAVDIGVSAADVEALSAKRGLAGLSFRQLRDMSARFPDRRNLEVAVHRQLSRPLSSFILLLAGVAIVLGLQGRSLVLGAAVAFGVSVSYYFVDIFLTGLGDRGEMPAVLSVWLPVALYLSLGVSRMFTIRT